MEKDTHPIEQYLKDMGAIRATGAGTVETSYYAALSMLLNEIGKKPNPKVLCVIQLQNKGAGMPDGGMFTADQFKSKAAKQEAGTNPLKTLPPSRGVIEVKSPAEDMAGIIASEQIARYRPFDTRWLYWEPETKLLDEKRSEYFSACRNGKRRVVRCCPESQGF